MLARLVVVSLVVDVSTSSLKFKKNASENHAIVQVANHGSLFSYFNMSFLMNYCHLVSFSVRFSVIQCHLMSGLVYFSVQCLQQINRNKKNKSPPSAARPFGFLVVISAGFSLIFRDFQVTFLFFCAGLRRKSLERKSSNLFETFQKDWRPLS